jgi:hypothetical protein
MAAMPAIPAAMILSAMAAMLNKGVFLTFTIPSKIKLWTWELNVQVRADASCSLDKRRLKTLFTLDAQSVADLFLM